MRHAAVVLGFDEIDASDLPAVGGKGANLGEMTKAGLPVPSGFCVTTFAYRKFLEGSREMNGWFDRLERIAYDDLEQIRETGGRIREHLASVPMPDDVRSAVAQAWERSGKTHAYAVRSSATAEDLPTASFAGQQDTYLNVRGEEKLLQAVCDCWASLFTDRAISYRAKNGFDHRSVYLSVVVQRMVFPDVSGILFTADPVTGRRNTTSIDAGFGLGEALVSGLVTADLYQVREGTVVLKRIARKEVAILPLPGGGTETVNLPEERRLRQALDDRDILRLAELGRRIEAHYGTEQDVEWALAEGKLYVLQSRPITSLYPLPALPDRSFRVLLNFNYIQVMTDPMKPLGFSLLSNILNFLKKDPASPEPAFLREAGGRAFADFTGPLSLPPVRRRILKVLGGMDEVMASAVSEVTEREEFRRLSVSKRKALRVAGKMAPIIAPAALKVIANLTVSAPEKANRKAMARIERIVAAAEGRLLSAVSGGERVRVVKEEMGSLLPRVLSKIVVYWVAGVISAGRLEKKLKRLAGEERTAKLLAALNKSLPGNVTTEIGLELGDLADTIRNRPELVEHLTGAAADSFFEGLNRVPGGAEFKRDLEAFLGTYGMRCTGEIDITKPRWREDPVQLVPSIVGNIRTLTSGEHRRKFRQGELEAEAAGREIVSMFPRLSRRAAERLVRRYRHLLGMREHHKYALVLLLDVYKRAIREEARALVERGVLARAEDADFLTLEELAALSDDPAASTTEAVVEQRKLRHERNGRLMSPRVMTSEGEIVAGKRRAAVAPDGALIGTPVSAGVAEGTARVVRKPEEARLKPGDILVAPYTDPGWTPLFTSIAALVTEVGGTMTHGSVIAREYGIPAVVGVDRATELVKDGDTIRVDGVSGFVQIVGRGGRE